MDNDDTKPRWRWTLLPGKGEWDLTFRTELPKDKEHQENDPREQDDE